LVVSGPIESALKAETGGAWRQQRTTEGVSSLLLRY